MARKKKQLLGRVISVRVTDQEMETMRDMMRITRKSASNVMREAIRLYQAVAPSP